MFFVAAKNHATLNLVILPAKDFYILSENDTRYERWEPVSKTFDKSTHYGVPSINKKEMIIHTVLGMDESEAELQKQISTRKIRNKKRYSVDTPKILISKLKEKERNLSNVKKETKQALKNARIIGSQLNAKAVERERAATAGNIVQMETESTHDDANINDVTSSEVDMNCNEIRPPNRTLSPSSHFQDDVTDEEPPGGMISPSPPQSQITEHNGLNDDKGNESPEVTHTPVKSPKQALCSGDCPMAMILKEELVLSHERIKVLEAQQNDTLKKLADNMALLSANKSKNVMMKDEIKEAPLPIGEESQEGKVHFGEGMFVAQTDIDSVASESFDIRKRVKGLLLKVYPNDFHMRAIQPSKVDNDEVTLVISHTVITTITNCLKVMDWDLKNKKLMQKFDTKKCAVYVTKVVNKYRKDLAFSLLDPAEQERIKQELKSKAQERKDKKRKERDTLKKSEEKDSSSSGSEEEEEVQGNKRKRNQKNKPNKKAHISSSSEEEDEKSK